MASLWRRWLGIDASRSDWRVDELDQLAAWRTRPRVPAGRSLAEQRWVVVDVESSGLDLMTDRLIAIGAVAVKGNAVDIADSFEVVLRQDAVSADENILIHGIAAAEQRGGVAPREALLGFLDYIAGDPLIAYHAFFDEGMLRRACRDHLGLKLKCDWLDLAQLAPAVLKPAPIEHGRSKNLDDWLADFGIQVSERHRAVADAVATAQLWLALLPALQRAGAHSCDQARRLAAEYAWLRDRDPRR
ncbi:MAG: 3'-5' exonuclease [Betaproteobacteria bacterium]|nr:3'-5' exonuclease [Betaproteobacteria bacterium]